VRGREIEIILCNLNRESPRHEAESSQKLPGIQPEMTQWVL